MPLRMIELVVSPSEGAAVRAALEEIETVDWWLHGSDDERLGLRILVEAELTDPLLDEVEKRFGSSSGFRIVIMPAEATLPRLPEPEPEEPPVEEPVEEAKKKPGSISREELLDDLSSGTRVSRVYLLTVVLSAIVTSVGLMRDNVAVVIGGMVIAPLLTPNMALALATTLGDLDLIRRSLRTILIGIGTAFALALLLGVLAPVDAGVAEISSRTVPHWADVILALASGTAGALAFTTGVAAGLVGVMVAVALLPPLLVSGLMFGAGRFGDGLGALELLAINIIAVNLAAVLTFVSRGVRPRTWWEADKARRSTIRAVTIWTALLLVLVALVVLD